MKRLVYSPKVQAWIKGTEGVVDVSPYIVSGLINRKVNQVSTAQLTLRNPVSIGVDYTGTLFTDFKRNDGTIGPLFHPMDPIIITMQRVEGHPVQVFTGYLDKSPYIQLFPGLCTVEASCTLKRLLYTQFDAALPFVTYFLSLFGWVPSNGGGGGGSTGIMNPSAELQKLQTQAGQIQNHFNDGSIGSLLYAVMVYIGQWDPHTIFIESLPKSIRDYVVTLYSRIKADVDRDQHDLQDLINQILGQTSYGGGSPTSGGGSTTGSVSGNLTVGGSPITAAQRSSAFTLLNVGTQLSAPDNAMLAIIYAAIGESNMTSGASGGGILQGTSFPNPSDDAAEARSFFLGGNGYQAGGAIACAKRGDPVWMIANEVEANLKWNTTRTDSYATHWGSGGQAAGLREAQAIFAAYKQSIQSGSTNPLLPSNNGLGIGGNAVSTAPTQTSQTGSDQGGLFSTLTSLGNQVASVSGTSPGGKQGNTTPSGGQGTRYQVMIEAANAIAGKQFPYAWGGGHPQVGIPSIDEHHIHDGVGFDCSGTTSAVLFAAGLITSTYTADAGAASFKSAMGSNILPGLDSGQNGVNIYVDSEHTFMQIGGRYFGTSDGNFQGGPGWIDPGRMTPSYLSRFTTFHIVPALLTQTTGNALPAAAGGPGGSATLPGGGTANNGGGTASTQTGTADAFSTMINLPSIFQTAEAVVFTGKRSFIADSPLFPFVEQLCQASMRNFMSMPNGNFFAFFPDYFGLFGRNYYWHIKDIEIIDFHLDISDDPLTTHVAVAGDASGQFHGTVDIFDLVLTAGIFDIFDAFALGYVTGDDTLVQQNLAVANLTNTQEGQSRVQKQEHKQEALNFLKKYGARTLVEEIPAIRSPIFELFYSFQKFMLMWSKQFMTTCELTFMPELFPGGLIVLDDHDIQLYVEEVTHAFDYTNGFTTTANFSSPASTNPQKRNNYSEGLTRTVGQAIAQGVKQAGGVPHGGF